MYPLLKQPTFKKLALKNGLKTAEGVVLHAFWKRTRGKNPSLPYNGEKNPFKALEKALAHSGLYFNGEFLREEFWDYDIDYSLLDSDSDNDDC